MSKELIQALKDNLATLRGMDSSLREAMELMQKKDFIFLLSDGTWDKANPKQGWEYEIYRLREDYEPEPEVVEVSIRRGPNGDLVFDHSWTEGECEYNRINYSLSKAVDIPHFAGFKYEDGMVRSDCRVYKHDNSSGVCCGFMARDIGDYPVLTPTHVLFRSKE